MSAALAALGSQRSVDGRRDRSGRVLRRRRRTGRRLASRTADAFEIRASDSRGWLGDRSPRQDVPDAAQGCLRGTRPAVPGRRGKLRFHPVSSRVPVPTASAARFVSSWTTVASSGCNCRRTSRSERVINCCARFRSAWPMSASSTRPSSSSSRAVSVRRSNGSARRRGRMQQPRSSRQFGEAPANPTSPSSSRCMAAATSLRYQLAHFADDPDFARVDLIYVSTIRGSSTRH